MFERKSREEKIAYLQAKIEKQLNKIDLLNTLLPLETTGTKNHKEITKAILKAERKCEEITQKLEKLGVPRVQVAVTIGQYDTLPLAPASATPTSRATLTPNLHGPTLVAANLNVENPIDWYNATKGNYGELPNVDDDQFESLFPSLPDNLDTLSRANAAPTPARPTPPPSVQDSLAQRANMDRTRLQTNGVAQPTTSNSTLNKLNAATPSAAPVGREQRNEVKTERSARAEPGKENAFVGELTATLARLNK